MMINRFRRALILSAMTAMAVHAQARLIAHYDFSDGDLLDNEVSESEYRLEQKSQAAGMMPEVLLNRAEGTAIFPGGQDSFVWLECAGPGDLPEFTISLWFRTDQIDQRLTSMGVVASGERRGAGSWQLCSDTRRQGNLRIRYGSSLRLVEASSCVERAGQWHHVLLSKERSGAMECTVTSEGGTVGEPYCRLEDAGSRLDEIVLGSNCGRNGGYRMEMANVQIYDSANIPVDALFNDGPGVRVPEQAKVWEIAGDLERLKQDEVEIHNTLSHLPVPEGTLQMDAYGAHSSYLPALEMLPEEPRWTVTLSNNGLGRVKEVYLIPAADRRDPALPGYGFPRRFRIIGTQENGISSVLFDWRDRDFPDPGRLPVRVIVPWGRYQDLRLEVFKGCVETGKEFFALDEIFVRGEFNLIQFREPRLSGSFEAPPFWSESYLMDGKTSLGLPTLPESDKSVSDYVTFFEGDSGEPFVVEMDFGENKRRGSISFYPAQPPEGVTVPGYGFPGAVKMEFFRERGGTQSRKLVKEYPVRKMQNPGNNIVRRFGHSMPAQWIRFTFSDLPRYEGKRVFGLGEIEITSDRKSVSRGCRVASETLSASGALHLLTDGVSGGRRVIPVLQWLDGLSLRRDLNRWLAKTRRLQERLTAHRNRFRQTVLAAGVSVLVVLLGGVALASVLLRQRQSNRFRQRITQDLHDDIGSKIGAVSLACTFLRRAVPDPQAQECGQDIEEIADDMKQALRDVLWFTSSKTDRLRELVCKLKDIADDTIPGEMLSLRHTPLREVPELPIRVEIKRDVMMFFKEVLHNAAKHAEASRINIGIYWERPWLYLCIRDDGKGFDLESGCRERSQFGLDGMRRRAKRLRADLVLKSAPGEGTTVELKLKVRKR